MTIHRRAGDDDASLADVIVYGRRVGAYTPRPAYCPTGCTIHAVIGYVVTRIARDGVPIEERDIVAVVADSAGYRDACAIVAEYRDAGRSWAIVERLYACGHRSTVATLLPSPRPPAD